MKASTFRMAKKNNALRIRDLLGILEALGEDPVDFFREVSDEDAPPSLTRLFLPRRVVLSKDDRRASQELRRLDLLRFDSPLDALRELASFKPKASVRWLHHCVLGSCLRFVDRNTEAGLELKKATESVGSCEELAEAIKRRAWVYFLERPHVSLELFERASHLFSVAGRDEEVAGILVNKAILAFHAAKPDVAISLVKGALDQQLSDRHRASGLQLLGNIYFQKDQLREARSMFHAAESAAAKLQDRYTKASLLWSFAKIEAGEQASRLFDRAIQLFDSQMIFHAVCCAMDKLERGLGDLEQTLPVLIKLCDTSPLPTLGDLLFDYLCQIREGKLRRMSEVAEAVRHAWTRWRTAQVRRLGY